MALNIKDKETEALVNEIASLTGETKTGGGAPGGPRKAAASAAAGAPEGREKRRGEFRRWLETEIWSKIPPESLGQEPMTKAEREAVLGYGPDGV